MPTRNTLVEAEWQAWQDLCEALKRSGGVTEQDLLSSVSANHTLGQVLLNKIRAWGALKSELDRSE